MLSGAKMNCKNCVCYNYDAEAGRYRCFSDPNWPAPCEYEEDGGDDE